MIDAYRLAHFAYRRAAMKMAVDSGTYEGCAQWHVMACFAKEYHVGAPQPYRGSRLCESASASQYPLALAGSHCFLLFLPVLIFLVPLYLSPCVFIPFIGALEPSLR